MNSRIISVSALFTRVSINFLFLLVNTTIQNFVKTQTFVFLVLWLRIKIIFVGTFFAFNNIFFEFIGYFFTI